MLRLLESKPSAPPEASPREQPAPTRAEPDPPLLCAHCLHPVTRESERLEVDGRHAHTRFNPAGFVFHFGAFARAAGARVEGPPVEEASWFGGCAWAYAFCAMCGTHLGWHFSGVQDFFGLVLERLCAPGGPGLG